MISDEVLECVAGWKEGSSSYLIGRTRPLKRYGLTNAVVSNTRIGLLPSPLDKSHQSTSLQHQDSKYQCFRYEMHVEKGQFVTKMSQSKKGSCEGLWSAVEGDRTYTLKKGIITFRYSLRIQSNSNEYSNPFYLYYTTWLVFENLKPLRF